ncbi:MAG TPA: LysR family transcriptional regulator [Jatrophihabitans sp.]|jgi:DNA-binding transcriptional LysR family regulator|uniref:LysR family transcriptional regulator n=1 Tax=Jatrophihabitans sp. TaxID=1932789 RepID=UPI002DFC59EE|nr:LysR family transcriptional regulator [Jatrophihabitans sp.]
MLDTLDPTRLRVFREVANRGSFTAAATHLRISQPAVSQHIAKLEHDTGVSLIERSPRRMRLTPPGRVLLRHADTLLQHLDSARRELSDLGGIDSGELRIATFPSAAATMVPRLVGQFRAELPNVTVQLCEADPPVSLPRLNSGDFDAVIAYDYPMLSVARDPGLHWQVLAEDHMAVALPADDPLARARSVSLADLAERDFVAPYQCICRDAMTDAARRARFSLRVASETNDYLAMLGLVGSGVGVAVVPRLIAPLTLPGVVLRPLADLHLRRTIAIVTRVGAYAPPSRSVFLDLAPELIPALGTSELPLQTVT